MIDEIQSENHFTRTEVEKLIHFVKEDVPSADLSQMPLKFDDQVLVQACMQHASVITREPFTHESLLIDKKEYQLSAREKEIAFREYQHDKRYFPCNGVGLMSRYSSSLMMPPLAVGTSAPTSTINSRFAPAMPPPSLHSAYPVSSSSGLRLVHSLASGANSRVVGASGMGQMTSGGSNALSGPSLSSSLALQHSTSLIDLTSPDSSFNTTLSASSTLATHHQLTSLSQPAASSNYTESSIISRALILYYHIINP